MARTKVICIDKSVCRDVIRPEVTDALNRALADLGLKATIGNISFTNTKLTTRLTITVDGVDVDKQEFVRHCWKFGLHPKHYGEEISVSGSKMKLVGIKPTSRRFPFICERADGKRFKVSATMVTGAVSALQA